MCSTAETVPFKEQTEVEDFRQLQMVRPLRSPYLEGRRLPFSSLHRPVRALFVFRIEISVPKSNFEVFGG